MLARHGETDWNREGRFQGHADPPLNDTGRAQAERLAAELDHVELSAVYSSPLGRATETARIVAAARGLEPIALDALREVDVGSWQGLTREEIIDKLPALQTPGPGHHYVDDVSSPTQTLVLSCDEYV